MIKLILSVLLACCFISTPAPLAAKERLDASGQLVETALLTCGEVFKNPGYLTKLAKDFNFKRLKNNPEDLAKGSITLKHLEFLATMDDKKYIFTSDVRDDGTRVCQVRDTGTQINLETVKEKLAAAFNDKITRLTDPEATKEIRKDNLLYVVKNDPSLGMVQIVIGSDNSNKFHVTLLKLKDR